MDPEYIAPQKMIDAAQPKTPEQIERETLITESIAKSAEIAGLQEKIRRLEASEAYLKGRSDLLVKVIGYVHASPIGVASQEERLETYEDIHNLLLGVR